VVINASPKNSTKMNVFHPIFRPTTLFLTLCCFWLTTSLDGQSEADYYTLEQVSIPTFIELEVGGMDFLPDDRLAVCTRREKSGLSAIPDQMRPILFLRGAFTSPWG
jgi:hypothetical protein